MEKERCFQEFLKYLSLNVIGMIGLSCYILADTYFIAKGLGANGLTALNLAIPIYSFINGSGLMLGMGGATKYSIFKSQDKRKNADQAFTNTVLLALGFAGIFFIIGITCSGLITVLLGADETIFQMSKTYLQMILLFAPAIIMNTVLLCFVRNDGAPQLSMAAMLGGSFFNIVLDYILIFPCNMGIFGAVLATGLAPVFSMLILMPFFIKKRNHFHLVKIRISGKLSKAICSGGLPSLITEVSSGIVIVIFNIIILRLEGNIGVAAYGVIANISLVAMSVYTGIAQGIQPMISKNYGIGNTSNVQSVLKYALTSMTILSGIIYAGVYFGAEQIAEMFNHEQNTVLQEIAMTGLRIYFIGGLFAGFNIVVSIYFTSMERPYPAHIISVLRGFFIIIPLAFLLSAVGGMTGVWCVFPITEGIVAMIGLILYINVRRTTVSSKTVA